MAFFFGWQPAHGRGEDPPQEGPETAKEVEQEAVGQSDPIGHGTLWVLEERIRKGGAVGQ